MKIVLVHLPLEAEQSVGESKSIALVTNIIAPLGIAYIAAVLEQNNYEVKIFDCTVGISHSELVEKLKEERPNVVGISSTTPAFESAKQVAKSVRRVLPNTVIVIGGAHVTAAPEEALSYDCFDVGVIGEGEITFLKLLRHIERNGLSNIGDVAGIVYRDGAEPVLTERGPFIENLDEIPFPARHLLPPLTAYRPTPASYKRLPLAAIMTSRGCPYGCTFCDRAVFGRRFRARSADNVLDEVEELINKYGAREIRFFDDTFTIDQKRVLEICDKFKERNIKVPWTCLTRVSNVTKELLAKMKEAGCWQVLYGLESGDAIILDLLNKGTTVEQNEQAVKWAKEVGLSVRADFIVGTPGETMESMRRTVEFAKRLPIDYAHFNKFVPFPGTELYNMLTQQGYAFDFTQSSIWDHGAILYVPDGISKEEYRRFLDTSFKEFYLRPGYILRRLLSIRSLDELKGQITGFWAILGL